MSHEEEAHRPDSVAGALKATARRGWRIFHHTQARLSGLCTAGTGSAAGVVISHEARVGCMLLLARPIQVGYRLTFKSSPARNTRNTRAEMPENSRNTGAQLRFKSRPATYARALIGSSARAADTTQNKPQARPHGRLRTRDLTCVEKTTQIRDAFFVKKCCTSVGLDGRRCALARAPSASTVNLTSSVNLASSSSVHFKSSVNLISSVHFKSFVNLISSVHFKSSVNLTSSVHFNHLYT